MKKTDPAMSKPVYRSCHIYFSRERGAEIPQFALLLLVFIPVFIAASAGIYSATRLRTEAILGSTSMPAPCIPMLDPAATEAPFYLRPKTPPHPLCVPYSPDACTYAPGTQEYIHNCFCCYP